MAAYISAEEVIGSASQEIGDNEFRKLGKPFYMSCAQRGLQRMCLDVPWDERQWSAEIPDSLILEIPSTTIGMTGVYLYNGSNCDFANVQNLHIKPNMYHTGGTGYVAHNVGMGLDITTSFTWNCPYPQNWIYFAGETKGKLYFSQSCAIFERIHISYTGIGMECWGECFDIPQWAREAITDYVIHKAACAMEQQNIQYYRGVIARKEEMLRANNPNGTWLQAQNYWGRMDDKERQDLLVSTTRFGYPPY